MMKDKTMPLTFNLLLREAGLPLKDVRLLRHKDQRAAKGRTPFELWRDAPPQFDLYQASQRIKNREKLKASYWASFVGTPDDETLFVGIYGGVKKRSLLDKDQPMPHMDGVDKAGTCDVYELNLESALSDLIGKLYLDWGPGKRSWIQRADRKDKRITELRKAFKEDEFPGFMKFREKLSKLNGLPKDWKTALQSSQGIYLLTCPKTREHYVGSASGEKGFWGRWQDYVQTGHGGDVALKIREPSDYQVSILEVVGSSANIIEILKLEGVWKEKLKSREMGLNRG